MDFLGPSVPLNEGQKIHSKIHDKSPANFTHVVKNCVAKSTLQEEGPEKCPRFSPTHGQETERVKIELVKIRRDSSGGMEWLGVWNCVFSGSEISNFGA